MSFTYSGDPASSETDELRFLIGDTDANDPLLQDAEIAYIVAEYTGKTQRLAAAFKQCATAMARRVLKYSLGPQAEDNRERLEYFKTQAKKYENMSKITGVPSSNSYSSDAIFDKGMMVNE